MREVGIIKSYDFIATCEPVVGFDIDDIFDGSTTTVQSDTGRMSKRKDVPHPQFPDLRMRLRSRSQLRLISQAPGQSVNNEYVFQKTNGQGANIFIIDSGFNVDHLVSSYRTKRDSLAYLLIGFKARPGGSPKTHLTPNNVTLAAEPRAQWGPESIYDNRGQLVNQGSYPLGHGTQVASVAAGMVHGTSSGSSLYLVKLGGDIRNPQYGQNGNNDPKFVK